MERSDDALVFAWSKHVRALGGELRLVVEFRARPAMTIALRGGSVVAKSVRAVG